MTDGIRSINNDSENKYKVRRRLEIVHSTGLVTRGMQDVKDFVV